MTVEQDPLSAIPANLTTPDDWSAALLIIIKHFRTDGGTIHLLGSDGLLHLKAHGPGMPEPVLQTIRTIPVGKGMAGLAVDRKEPVTACNLQTDQSGDVRPGARATGLQGAIVVPMMHSGAVKGALGVANQQERVFSAEEIALLEKLGEALIDRAADGA